MKNFSKEQIIAILSSLLSLAFIILQLLTLDSSASEEIKVDKYQSSLDSIETADSVISNYQTSVFTQKRDIFNFKVIQKKKKVVVTDNTPKVEVIKTKWINTDQITLYTKDKISFSFFFNGKAKFNIDGKTVEVIEGDELTVGNKLLKEVVVGSNQATGNTKSGDVYKGKVLSVGARAVYVDSPIKDKVVQFKQNSDPLLFARNLMPTSGGDSGEPEPDNDRDRRPHRGGRP